MLVADTRNAEEIMGVCRQSHIWVAGYETRRDGQEEFSAAFYTVYRSGTGGGGTEVKGQL